MQKKLSEKHVCKFKRLKYKSGNYIFFCTLPDCNKKLSTALALGKRSICWRCGEPFIMNEYSLRLAKPHCQNCHKSKTDAAHVSTTDSPTEVNMTIEAIEKSLAERLTQAINSAKPTEDEDEI